MKAFYTVLVITLAMTIVSAKSGEHQPMAGCEDITKFQNLEPKSCCESLPNIFNPDALKKCFETCKSKDENEGKKCCMVDCVLKSANLLNSTGFIDFNAVKNALNQKMSNNEKWTAAIKNATDTCEIEAPMKLVEWKKVKPMKCETAINMVAKHCIYRNLIFNCPDMKSSPECKAYIAFGKKCPIFPMIKRPMKNAKDAEEFKEE